MLAFVCYLAYGYHSLKLQSAEAARTREALETEYQSQLARYQQDLPPGTPRAEVRKYLDLRKIQYNESGGAISIFLGDEPDVGTCNYWRVSVALDFPNVTARVEPSPQDVLGSVSLKRLGHCL